MRKTLNTIVSLVLIALAGILFYYRFSGSEETQIDHEKYYNKLEPINLVPKEFQAHIVDTDDIGIKFAHLWNLAELHKKMSESCLETFIDQHPNNIVQKDNLISLYGIEIGTDNWYKLTSAYEKYATEVCYSYSGHEIEELYSKSLRQKMTEEELSEIYRIYSTETGEKYVAASNFANNNIGKFIAEKQRDTIKIEAEKYNRLIEELQN